jgi:hypothetical protein|tara:strand:- start:690 stop:1307 length:618 start_codon:yes stop_codon:yes gene_type:complete
MTVFLPDPAYDPNAAPFIDSETKLGPETSMATFLGSYGNRCSLDFIPDQETRRSIARYLYLHAEIIRQFNQLKEFADYRLIVAESLSPNVEGGFAWPDDDAASPSNFSKNQGRAVVYQLIDQSGNIAHNKIFDLASFWKDYISFDFMFLDYDTYNPDGTLTSSIVLYVPTLTDAVYTMDTPQRLCETLFNGDPIDTKYLREVLPA